MNLQKNNEVHTGYRQSDLHLKYLFKVFKSAVALIILKLENLFYIQRTETSYFPSGKK